MKKLKPANKRFYIVLAVIGALLVGWWAWGQFSPKPLGDKLEYVGSRNYGCWLFCDEVPGRTYSYATNMTPPELKEYFNKAVATKPEEIKEWQNAGDVFSIKFTPTKNNKSFTIYYYTDAQKRIQLFNLRPTNYKYLIDVDANDYDIVRNVI